MFPFLVKVLIRCQEWTWMDLFENINNWRCPMFFGAGHSQNTNNWGHIQILWDLSFQWSTNLFWYISAFSGRCACSILHWNICARGIMFCFLLPMLMYCSNDRFLLNGGYLVHSEVDIEQNWIIKHILKHMP